MDYSHLAQTDPTIYQSLLNEQIRQSEGIELIASENYVSEAVLEALGNVFTNKYSEGYPGKRYYGGQMFTDEIEELAIDRAKKLFNAEHVNVQPHSGAPANIAVYFALMKPGDTIIGMDLSHGGHLTHGHPVTHMATIFNFIRYKMKNVETGEIDYDELLEVAKKEKPKIILAGFSAYPRELNYQKFQEIATQVGALTMADIAHIAGLIAAGELKNPFDYGFDIITTTTHKTLRGPRGGMIMCKKEHAKAIDKSVFPGFQGGPHMNNTAAKAVAFGEALQPEFKDYAKQVIQNAKKFAEVFMENGCRLITNGTDNHLMLIDTVSSFSLTGKQTETILDDINVTLNKNMIADDPRSPMDPSGVRLGSPAITTRGMKEAEIETLAHIMIKACRNPRDEALRAQLKQEVKELCLKFPIPGCKLNQRSYETALV